MHMRTNLFRLRPFPSTQKPKKKINIFLDFATISIGNSREMINVSTISELFISGLTDVTKLTVWPEREFIRWDKRDRQTDRILFLLTVLVSAWATTIEINCGNAFWNQCWPTQYPIEINEICLFLCSAV